MSPWRQLCRGLRALINRSGSDREIADEVDDYLTRLTAAHRARGLPPEEAHRAARVEMGQAANVCEIVRAYGWENRIETLIADLRYAIRSLRATPGFTCVVILTLALGIGANTAIFSVVYAALLGPLPYFQPARLLALSQTRSEGDERFWDASYPDFLDWQKQSRTFQSLAGFSTDSATVRGAGEPEILMGAEVTTNFFATLGVKPFLGRDFAAGEDIGSGPTIVILSYSFWRDRFGGDPGIIGRILQLDNHSVTVAGVLPRQFEFAPSGAAQYWVPLHLSSNRAGRRNMRWMSVFGRLATGATELQARAEMEVINRSLAAAYPQQDGAVRVVVRPLRDWIVGPVQPLLVIVFGAVIIVLLIACANVANLLIARASRRRREFAIRAVLGAGWSRLISQSLTESGVLATAGSALGLVLAHWGTVLLLLPIPDTLLAIMPFLHDAHTNPAVLAFATAAAVLVALACGFAGALEAFHQAGSGAIQEDSRTATTRAGKRLRDMLVIGEVAFSLVLLIGAGLMSRSLEALLHRDPGFNTHNLLTFIVNLPADAYPGNADAVRFNDAFTARLRAITGIVDVAANSVLPLNGGGNTIRFVIDNEAVVPGHEDESNVRQVSSNYFSLMGIPLISGRLFDDHIDTPESPNRIIVSEAWVRRYMPGQSPLGRRVRFTNSPTQPYREIIGVVPDIADAGLDSALEPNLYMPTSQSALTFIPYLARTEVPPATLLGPIRAALKAVDPALLVIRPITVDEIADQSPAVFLRRYPSYLIGSFAALALFLTVIGLYGLISYSVAQRNREFGIRIALGARPQNVLRLILGEGTRLIVIGLAAGIAAALVLTRLMSTLLFGISPADPLTFVAVAALLALVAAMACSIPARRAVRTDPIVALREM